MAGIAPAKKHYFYGVKVHFLVTKTGASFEVFLTPGPVADVITLESFTFDLSVISAVYTNRGYTDYDFKDDFHDTDGTVGSEFMPIRKFNSKKMFPSWVPYLQHCHRKIVETAGSLVESLLPQSIYAVTAADFELKVILFVLVSAIKFAR